MVEVALVYVWVLVHHWNWVCDGVVFHVGAPQMSRCLHLELGRSLERRIEVGFVVGHLEGVVSCVQTASKRYSLCGVLH